jgi:hypothetical protein
MTVDERLPRSTRTAPEASNTAYNALTLIADKVGNIIWSSVSEWVGFGSKLMWERRAPGLINPHRVQAAWRTAGQDSTVVRDRASLGNFLRAGGNALVAQPIARQWLPDGQCCVGRSVRMTERADENDRLSDGRRELVECCADPVAGGGRRWRVRSGRGGDSA